MSAIEFIIRVLRGRVLFCRSFVPIIWYCILFNEKIICAWYICSSGSDEDFFFAIEIKWKFYFLKIHFYEKLNGSLTNSISAGYCSKDTYTSMYRNCLYDVPVNEYTQIDEDKCGLIMSVCILHKQYSLLKFIVYLMVIRLNIAQLNNTDWKYCIK